MTGKFVKWYFYGMRPSRKPASARPALERLKSDLESDAQVRQALDRLEAAGAHRSMVLSILTEIIRQAKRPSSAHSPQGQRRYLKGLAGRIRRMADEIERFYGTKPSDPNLSVAVNLQLHRDGSIFPVSEQTPRPLLEGLRACASDVDELSRMAGQIAKLAGPGRNRANKAMLLSYLQGTTGNARKHLGTVCEMLNAAYEAGEINYTVTSDSLEKLLTRHVIPKGR